MLKPFSFDLINSTHNLARQTKTINQNPPQTTARRFIISYKQPNTWILIGCVHVLSWVNHLLPCSVHPTPTHNSPTADVHTSSTIGIHFNSGKMCFAYRQRCLAQRFQQVLVKILSGGFRIHIES